jgi:hypothetical protein
VSLFDEIKDFDATNNIQLLLFFTKVFVVESSHSVREHSLHSDGT